MFVGSIIVTPRSIQLFVPMGSAEKSKRAKQAHSDQRIETVEKTTSLSEESRVRAASVTETIPHLGGFQSKRMSENHQTAASRLLMPINPTRADPISQTAAGTGTGATVRST
jgi:hypothetical protein